MNLELDTAVKELELKYNVLGKFYFSNFFTPTGKKDLHNWLKSCYQEKFEPKDRLLFIQDINEVYEYDDLPGLASTTLQKFAAKIDISNCFITVVTPNKNIEAELKQSNDLFCKSVDNINFHLVLGPSFDPVVFPQSDTFCVAPWVHLYVGTDGNVLPCCAGTPEYPLGNVNKTSILEIMNSDNAIKLRKNMMTGKRCKECASCYYKEDRNLPSLREKLNNDFKELNIEVDDNGTVLDFTPLSLDIRLNKICNLKCRSCGPYYSSAIAQEFQEIYSIKDEDSLSNKQRKEVLPEILSYLPKVKSIYFGGGEPLIMLEQYTMTKELINIGNTDVGLLYNTNFTNLTFKDTNILELWKNFTTVELAISLDGFGAVAEYWRHGTVWNDIEDNLERVKLETPHVKIFVASTVGIVNVENLILFQRAWSNSNKLKLSQFSIRQIIQNSPMSIQVLPEHHKNRLAVIIQAHIKWCQANLAEELANEWQDVYNFMLASDESYLLPQFKEQTLLLDNHRNESFVEVFPQYADLLLI
jgi:radical SAM protein with 4Fe4S-binding SPASM domain